MGMREAQSGRLGPVTTTLLDMPPTEVRSRIEMSRQRYLRAIDAAGPTPEARQWRVSRFDRGLKIADELERRLGSIAGKRILDVGAAHGGDVAALCARGATCVGADKFDYGYEALKHCLAAGGQLDFTRFDCTGDWPLPDQSFDVVLCLAVIEHVEDLGRFFSELLRVLKPGGVAMVDTATALRGAHRDPLYQLPLISMLPMSLRRFVAVKVFRRHYEFQLSDHTFYSAGKFRRYVAKRGFEVLPCKYTDSPMMAKLSRWPLAEMWQSLLRHFVFDFVLIQRKRGY